MSTPRPAWVNWAIALLVIVGLVSVVVVGYAAIPVALVIGALLYFSPARPRNRP